VATAALSLPRYQGTSSAKARAKGRLAFPVENTILWVLGFAAYIAAAAYLVLHLHYYINDGITRVDNAFDVLFSRDPHLGAIGFFWGPLPSFLDLPIIAFKGWWPPLANQAFAGSIEAAAFSAGSMVLINVGLRWAGVVRGLRYVICAFWAINPMLIIFGVQGMAEAPFVFFFLAAMVVFMRWSESRRGSLLPLMGILAGCAALCRNEALLFAFALGVGVILQSFRNERNWRRVETEALMYGLPALLFIGLWIGSQAILLHNPLYFINGVGPATVGGGATSVTPTPPTTHVPTPTNSITNLLIQSLGAQVVQGAASWAQAAFYVFAHAVLLFPAFVAMIGVLVARVLAKPHRVGGLVILACGLSTLLVDVYVLHSHGLGNYLRYQIIVIPFAYVIAIYVLRSVRHRRALLSSLMTLIFGLVFGLSNVFTATTLSNPGIGLEEAGVMSAASTGQTVPLTGGDYGDLVSTPQELSQVLSMDTDHGLILCDSAFCFTWNLMAPDPQEFVVTSDRDWFAALHQPLSYHVEYFLVPVPNGPAAGDSLNELYPNLWADGGGFAALVGQTSDGAWRLYRITGETPAG
jgi:hypothetical protein